MLQGDAITPGRVDVIRVLPWLTLPYPVDFLGYGEHAFVGHHGIMLVQFVHQSGDGLGRGVQNQAQTAVRSHNVLCCEVPIVDEAYDVPHHTFAEERPVVPD